MLLPMLSAMEDLFLMPLSSMDAMKNPMKMDVKEVEGGYEHILDIPGFPKESISISLKNRYLTIKAEVNSDDDKKEDEKYIVKERTSKSMSRTIYVGDVSQDEIKAKFKDGVLTVFIPKTEKKDESANIDIE